MSESESTPSTFKPKKSVALSGVAAGNTAICTVGRSGNDLHYRGYDIKDLAEQATFEEVAHLLVHEHLPTRDELAQYQAKLKRLRGLPPQVQDALELLPANTHPMDVMRTGCSVLGTVLPEKEAHSVNEARDIADRLMASFGSMLLYWYHYSHNGRRIDTETDDGSIAAHFLHLLHGEPPSELHARALDQSLVLYAEHEFNASTFAARVITGTGSDIYSAITGAIGALRGPKHGGANEVAMDIIARYRSADEAEVDIRARMERKEIIIGFGHPVYTIGDPRNPIIKSITQATVRSRRQPSPVRGQRAHRDADVGPEEDVPEPRLVQRFELPHDGRADADVHAAVRDRAHHRLERARHRAAHRRQDHPPERELHRTGRPRLRRHRPALSGARAVSSRRVGEPVMARQQQEVRYIDINAAMRRRFQECAPGALARRSPARLLAQLLAMLQWLLIGGIGLLGVFVWQWSSVTLLLVWLAGIAVGIVADLAKWLFARRRLIRQLETFSDDQFTWHMVAAMQHDEQRLREEATHVHRPGVGIAFDLGFGALATLLFALWFRHEGIDVLATIRTDVALQRALLAMVAAPLIGLLSTLITLGTSRGGEIDYQAGGRGLGLLFVIFALMFFGDMKDGVGKLVVFINGATIAVGLLALFGLWLMWRERDWLAKHLAAKASG